MKNLKAPLLVLFFAAFVFSCLPGCKKDNNTASPHTGKIKSMGYLNTGTNGTTMSNITYDSQDRIVGTVNIPDGYDSFVYQGNRILLLYYEDVNNLSAPLTIDTFTLNAQGYLSNGSIANGITRTFDANGYVLTETKNSNTASPITTTHVYSNGNEQSASYTDGGGQLHTYTYQYNTHAETHGHNAAGSPYWGKDNANLISRVIQNDGGTDLITDYTYEYDTQGRVTKETQVGYLNQTTTYTYY